jgi:hypothetical protein
VDSKSKSERAPKRKKTDMPENPKLAASKTMCKGILARLKDKAEGQPQYSEPQPPSTSTSHASAVSVNRIFNQYYQWPQTCQRSL